VKRPLAALAMVPAALIVVASGRVSVPVSAAVADALQVPSGSPTLRVMPVRGNVYLLSGAGANITVSVGKDGVLLVDSGSAATSQVVLDAVRELSRRVTSAPGPARSCVGASRDCAWWSSSEFLPTTGGPPAPRPVIGIINTSDDESRIGGNAVIAAAGRTFGVRNLTSNSEPGAWVLAHENVALRLSKAGQTTLIASESYFGREKKLNFINGEGVVVTHLPDAHTSGDSLVYFRGSDVLAAGGVLDMTGYPVIDMARGGSVQGVIDALNWILDVAVVEHMMEGGTMIVPGRGRLTDAADVAYYRDMMTIVRDRIREWRGRGMSLDEITAARPTREYDRRFGRNPAWTPSQLVEAVYRTLDHKPPSS